MPITTRAEFEVERPPRRCSTSRPPVRASHGSCSRSVRCPVWPVCTCWTRPPRGRARPGPPTVGATKQTDGGELTEELLAHDRPSRHRYRWTENDLRPPFTWLVKGGEGDWTFHATERGTRIVWDYHFDLTSGLAYPLAAPIAAAFRRWMQRGLERLPDALDTSRRG